MCTVQPADKARLALIVAFSALLGPPVMNAQKASTPVIADIPFSFQIGYCSMPAGKYTVEMKGNDVLSIKGDSGVGAMMVMWAVTNRMRPDSAIIFHRYGDEYFLREVRSAGNQGFLWSGETKAERRAKLRQDAGNPNSGPREDSKVEIALLTPPR
jgi:hypothetical protein